MHPIAYHASLHQWQLFVTLTYESRGKRGNALKVPDEVGRRAMLFAYLRRAGLGRKKVKVEPDLSGRLSLREIKRRTEQASHGQRIERVPFAGLLWCAREERGEKNGRYHYHILLDGFPPSRLNTAERFVQETIWRSIGGGNSTFRAFDPRLAGVQYVMKGLDEWSLTMANAYEMRKLATSEEDRMLILAEACVRKWAQVSIEPKATAGTCNRVITRASLSDRRKAVAQSTAKETPEQLERRIRSSWLNAHPAGASFVV